LARTTAGLDQRRPLGRRLAKLFAGAALDARERLIEYYRWSGADFLHSLYTSEFRARLSDAAAARPMEEMLDTVDTQELDESEKDRLTQAVAAYVEQREREKLEERLRILYEYQEKYLELVQEYKEEIKFVNTIQEDLRRERAQFFSQTLKEVSSTLEQAQIGDEVAEEWIRELVGSYTSSLDVGRDLAKSRVSNMVGKLRKRTENEADAVESDESQ
jgi:hypothetical protein